MFGDLNKARWGELFTVLGEAGFDPSKFERVAGNGGWAGFVDSDVPTIGYRGSDYYFSIAKYLVASPMLDLHDTGQFMVAMRPGKVEDWESRKGLSWEQVVAACREWAGFLRAEIETPDFWARTKPEAQS